MKTLYLLRHAKAESGGPELSDAARRLSPRGREACSRMATHMHRHGESPQYVLCSSSERTRETWERLQDAMETHFPGRLEEKLYLATAGEILHQIHQTDDAFSSLMVIGHNPGMHHLALLLVSPEGTPLRDALELKYPAGALCALRFTASHWRDLAPGKGEIVDFTAPREADASD